MFLSQYFGFPRQYHSTNAHTHYQKDKRVKPMDFQTAVLFRTPGSITKISTFLVDAAVQHVLTAHIHRTLPAV